MGGQFAAEFSPLVYDSFEYEADYEEIFTMLFRGGCGQDTAFCFCDLLENVRTYYFEHVPANKEAIYERFAEVFESMDLRKKTAFLYLNDSFLNLSFLNLYPLTEGFDAAAYLEKMCFPYQPDSEDAMYVQRTLSAVFAFLVSPR